MITIKYDSKRRSLKLKIEQPTQEDWDHIESTLIKAKDDWDKKQSALSDLDKLVTAAC
jgi:hypothetical protein